MSERPPILGLVGQPLSGKDTVAGILVDHGYTHVSTGDLLREYIKDNGLGVATRPLQKKVANQVRAQHGGDYFVRLALEATPRPVVVSGIRTIAEAERLQAEGGRIIWVEAPQRLRFERLQGRNRASDALTFEQFQAEEAAESRSDNPDEQSVASLEVLADVPLVNDGDPKSLREAVERDVLGLTN